MTDHGALGGLQPIGDRYAHAQPRGHGQSAPQGGSDRAMHPADSVELSEGRATAALLLEQRVLAYTRDMVPGCPPHPGTIVQALPVADPQAVAERIQAEQRWLCGDRAGSVVLFAAFLAGAEDAEAILKERGVGDLTSWFEAVRGAARGN